MSCESNGDLVTFNVGGKIYQVLREPTLSLHPTWLLTQMAEDQKDDKPIFVEGDQDLFKYVIEYHRDRKIYLPITVSKDAMLRELKRFGLEPKADQILEDCQLGNGIASVKKRVRSWAKENEKQLESFKAEMMGNLVAQVAAEFVLERETGNGFQVRWPDVLKKVKLTADDKSFDQLFGGVSVHDAAASGSVQDFARSCGYSVKGEELDVSHRGTTPWMTRCFWVSGQNIGACVRFTPAA